MSHPEPPEYVAFLAPYPPATQKLHRELRQKLIDLLPPHNEFIYDATNTVTTGFGFTTKPLQHFIHLPIYTQHVNIGFNFGTDLEDREGRLQGKGSRIRHIQLKSVEDLTDPYTLKLIEQAITLAPTMSDPLNPEIKIIVMNGPKRRPK